MRYTVKHIINESVTGKEIYRTLDTQTGRIRDVSRETFLKYKDEIDVSKAVELYVNNLDTFKGRLVEGVNDFETWCRLNDRLDLLEEYATDLNEKPVNRISKGAIDIVYWRCKKCKHVWSINIKSRTGKATNSGCPECAYKEGRYHKLVVGDNDLETYCKKHNLDILLREYSSLNPKKPNEITAKSSKESLIWKCSRCGNTYNNFPANRINGQGCPNCAAVGSSIPEMTIYYFLSEEIAHVEHRKKIDSLEADIYLPDYKTIIDYRGEYWHSLQNTIERDNKKYQYFANKGLRQIIIEERAGKDNVTHYSQKDNCIYFKPNQYDKLFHILKEILKLEININDRLLKRIQNTVTIAKQRKEVINSVAELHPDVARRWDYERNGDFLPTQVTPGSSLKAWFICDKCHLSYYSFIRKQVNGQGCSYCNGTTAFKGINDIETTLPGIQFVWDFEENEKNNITPYNIKAGSNKEIYLRCFSCNHPHKTISRLLSRTNTFRCKNCGAKLDLKQ